MKLYVVIVTSILIMACESFSYEEWSLPNLTAPTVINPLAIEAQIQHQFWGHVDGKDNASRLFGISDGADARIGVRTSVLPRTQVFAFFDNMQLTGVAHNEFSLGVSNALFLSKLHLRMQVEGEVFSYASLLVFPETRKNGIFIQGCFQSDLLFNHVMALCNVGYNFDSKDPGLGIGLDIAVTESFHACGEYFPFFGKTDTLRFPSGVRNPFSFGIKFTTYGHQFFFFAGNAKEMGSRNLMRGTSDNYLRLGFMLKRLFIL
jgi:hypothetical protein